MIRLALVYLQITGMDGQLIVYAIGYIGAFLVVAACTTCCSISMEGKNLWLIQSLPVSGFDVLVSKLMVNLTLTIPTSLIVSVGAGLTLQMSAAEMAAITALELSYALFSAALGLLVNLKSHNFEWKTETAVVKQSAAVGIAMLVNLTVVIGPAALTFVFAEYAALIFGGAAVFAALAGAGLLLLFRVKGDQMIRTL